MVYVAPAEGLYISQSASMDDRMPCGTDLDNTTVPPSESVIVTISAEEATMLPPGATATMDTGDVVIIVEPTELVWVIIVAGAIVDVTWPLESVVVMAKLV